MKTANYTAAASDYVPVDTTSGAVTVTLPTAPADKTQIGVKHVVRGSTNTVTVACGGSDVLNKTGGSTTGTLTLLNQSAVFQYKASTAIWYVVGGDLPLSQLDSRYQAAPTLAQSAAQYVTTDGNDSRDGLTWGTSKLTIQAAINALPLAADGVSRNGTVEVGYGTFNVTSSYFTRTVTTTNGSATVVDASTTSADLGSLLNVTTQLSGVPVGAKITAVNPGVGFTMQYPATFTGTRTISFDRPGVAMDAGVRIRGRGDINGQRPTFSTNYPTQIYDNGTGTAVMSPVGTGSGGGPPPASAARLGATLEGLCVLGNLTNRIGFQMVNCSHIVVRSCTFKNHGVWGIQDTANATVYMNISDCLVYENGDSTLATTLATGGMALGGSPSIGTVINTRVAKNWGVGCLVSAGVHLLGCDFEYSIATQYSTSGVGLYITAAAGPNGVANVFGGWLEGNVPKSPNNIGQIHVAGVAKIIGVTFQGSGTTGIGISCQPIAGYPVSIDSCDFQGHTLSGVNASIYLANASAIGPVYWKGCHSQDNTFARTQTGAYTNVAVADAGMDGSYGGGRYTMATAPTAVTLTSGSNWQNTTGSDVLLAVPVTFTAGGTAAVARGQSTTPTALGTVTRQAADTDVLEYFVPAKWYFAVTLTGASFSGTATAQRI